jgi:hypothetical protein
MLEEKLPKSLQESILAALLFDKAYGSAIAAQIDINHFDDSYRDLARKALAYRKDYGVPPGEAHIDDLFDKELAESKRGSWYRKTLAGLLTLSDGLNAQYAADRAGEFIRRQELKRAILRSSERYQQGGEALVEDIEAILHSALRVKAGVLDAGTFLNDPKGFSFLDRRTAPYPTGIKELDRMGIGASPKELLLYIAPKGTGKSWFCVRMGKHAYIEGGKILHITLEMREDLVFERYVQVMFTASWEKNYEYAKLEFDEELKSVISWRTRTRRPRFDFTAPDVRSRLQTKMHPYGLKFGRILIKEFPSGQLTVDRLTAYLDFLAEAHGFVPTMLIVDYPDLMKNDPRNFRITLERNFVELRGLAVERGYALVCPTQAGRKGIGASYVRSTDVSEGIGKVFVADNVITYSRTRAEEKAGTARLYVDHARNTRGAVEVVISQAYSIGQFCVASGLMSPDYWKKVQEDQHDVTEEDEE